MKEYTKPSLTDMGNIENIVTFAAASLAAKAIGALVGYAATRAVTNAVEITGLPQGMTGLEQVLSYE